MAGAYAEVESFVRQHCPHGVLSAGVGDAAAELPDVIPVETCCLRWQESLTLLAKLVEAETRD
jgi:hypothetical protein